MKELLVEFLQNILEKGERRKPNTVWKTAKGWGAKKSTGEVEYRFKSEKAARAWLVGKTPPTDTTTQRASSSGKTNSPDEKTNGKDAQSTDGGDQTSDSEDDQRKKLWLGYYDDAALSAVKEYISGRESDLTSTLPKDFKTKDGGINHTKIAVYMEGFFRYSGTPVEQIPSVVASAAENGIDLVSVAISGGNRSHGNFIKFTDVSTFADALTLTAGSNDDALANLSDTYLRFFSPSSFEFKRANGETLKDHLQYFMGSDGGGAKKFFGDITDKLRSIMCGENTIKDNFLKIAEGPTLISRIVNAAWEKEKISRETENADSRSKKKNTTSRAEETYKKALAEELEDILFPSGTDGGDAIYNEDVLKNLLVRLRVGDSKERRGILTKIRSLRYKIESEIFEESPYLSDLQSHFNSAMKNYRRKMADLTDSIVTGNGGVTVGDAARKIADEALRELFTIPTDLPAYANMRRSDVRTRYVKTLNKILAKFAETHEFYRELLAGEEVYLPESPRFPCGDKMRVSSGAGEHIKIERVSVKTGDTVSNTGAQSEFGQYPFWKSVYKNLGLGSMGWRYDQPYQLPREYADDANVYATVIKESGITKNGILKSEQVEGFRELVMALQSAATGDAKKDSHLDSSGKKLKTGFAGDSSLRTYVTDNTSVTGQLFSVIKEKFNQNKELQLAIAGDCIKDGVIDNDLHAGDSYLGYLLEGLSQSIGLKDAKALLEQIDLFEATESVIEKGKNAGQKKTTYTYFKNGKLNVSKLAVVINERVLAKYFDLDGLSNFMGERNYQECLKRGPMYAMTAIVANGALTTHNGFAGAVSHRHYILNNTETNARFAIRSYTGLPTLRDWGLKLDLFHTRDGAWSLSNHTARFGAGVRIVCKGTGEH
jgi:hypothetical protein